MELNGAHQLLIYADNVNILSVNTNTIKRSTQALLEASKLVGLEVNAEKTTCMFMPRHQNSSHQNHKLLKTNESFRSVANFRYFEKKVTNRNYIQREIKSRLNSGNACYHSVQNLVFPYAP
jgi:hypothetical protein